MGNAHAYLDSIWVLVSIAHLSDTYSRIEASVGENRRGASQFLELVIIHIFLKKGDRPKIGLQNPDASVEILNRFSQMR
nr:hypothetical protein [Iphinoe sp. HA4291-MV1]